MNTDIGTIEVRGLSKAFGENQVLRGVDFSVSKGEVVVVMGPSGSGKTTLLRSLNFLEVPDAGGVTVCGIDVECNGLSKPSRQNQRKIRAIRQRTAMVFQSFNLFPHRTALENVMEGPVSVKGVPRAQASERAIHLLTQVGLAAKANEYPARLSGGQKQRVAIARALAMDPEVIFFDEPTSALDPALREDVLTVMRDVAKAGMTMLIVTHELQFARDVADRIVFMDGGVVAEDTTPQAFFGEGSSPRVRQFLHLIET
ncbi:cystine transport system ATP-binding protein [Paraburkholderia sp. WSM4175]|uniref:amino acid ABC transporter ATP-binding protein n=1 Tax=Paraburkholderia sp. WSM4175 TaxID=2991072 RepID=UPI003D1A56B9